MDYKPHNTTEFPAFIFLEAIHSRRLKCPASHSCLYNLVHLQPDDSSALLFLQTQYGLIGSSSCFYDNHGLHTP